LAMIWRSSVCTNPCLSTISTRIRADNVQNVGITRNLTRDGEEGAVK
jgi:hypothetical protein